ncbi:MAG: 6-bladed beta-propeller, partial [Bacteroidaceae bacterium]
MAGCAEKGRRNDLHPLTDNSFDEECPQHIVITADSVKPFETVENEACLHVDLPQEMTETCLDTVFSSYTFVPLETKEECLIGQITKIIKCPGCYCILDRDNANVFLFEEDGRFRCKLG